MSTINPIYRANPEILKTQESNSLTTLAMQTFSTSSENRVLSNQVSQGDPALLAKLQEEVPELSEILGRKADWLDAIYIFFELLKLSIEGKKQEHIWRSAERKLQLEQIDEVVKNLEKTAKDQFSSGMIGGITGILSGVAPMLGYTGLGDSCLSVFKSAFDSLKELKTINAFNKLGDILKSMSQMEQGMSDVRRTYAESGRHDASQRGEITRSYCDDISRNRQEISQDHQSTLQAILQFIQQNKELVNSLYGAN